MKLSAYGRPVSTPFHLIGADENAMTFALGWCLANVPTFLTAFASDVSTMVPRETAHVALQEHRRANGITDIEIVDQGKLVWIVEAKVGFAPPSSDQLLKYATYLNEHHPSNVNRCLVVLTKSDSRDESLAFAKQSEVEGIRIRYISWRRALHHAKATYGRVGNIQKSYLRDLIDFLEETLSMQNMESNSVYVVSLSDSTFGGGTVTFKEVVSKHNHYFHPVGDGWPYDPPNYIAFRFDGRLQSIHHIDSYKIITSFQPYFEGIVEPDIDPHFLYDLGPAMRPDHIVANGPGVVRAGRVWASLDLLLTSETITEARNKTAERRERVTG